MGISRCAVVSAAVAVTAVGLAGPAAANPALVGDYVFDWRGDNPFRENVRATSCGDDCLAMDFGDGDVVEYRYVDEVWMFTRFKDDAVTCDNGDVVGAEQTTYINSDFTAGKNVASADCGRGVLPMRPAPFTVIRLD